MNLATLSVVPPAGNEDNTGFTLTVTATATERETTVDLVNGPELSTNDNTANATWDIVVTVTPVNDEASVEVATAYGEEDLGADAASLTPADPGPIPLSITLDGSTATPSG